MLILLYLFYYCDFYKFNLIYYRFWPTGKILVLLVKILVGPKQIFELYLENCQTWPWNLFISCGNCVSVLQFKPFKVTMLLLLWEGYVSFCGFGSMIMKISQNIALYTPVIWEKFQLTGLIISLNFNRGVLIFNKVVLHFWTDPNETFTMCCNTYALDIFNKFSPYILFLEVNVFNT